jgi:hypothetical protein
VSHNLTRLPPARFGHSRDKSCEITIRQRKNYQFTALDDVRDIKKGNSWDDTRHSLEIAIGGFAHAHQVMPGTRQRRCEHRTHPPCTNNANA